MPMLIYRGRKLCEECPRHLGIVATFVFCLPADHAKSAETLPRFPIHATIGTPTSGSGWTSRASHPLSCTWLRAFATLICAPPDRRHPRAVQGRVAAVESVMSAGTFDATLERILAWTPLPGERVWSQLATSSQPASAKPNRSGSRPGRPPFLLRPPGVRGVRASRDRAE